MIVHNKFRQIRKFVDSLTHKFQKTGGNEMPFAKSKPAEALPLQKKSALFYFKRDWQLYALMLLPMVFIIVFK